MDLLKWCPLVVALPGLILPASGAVSGAPHPVFGFVSNGCSPEAGAAVRVTNQRSGAVLSATTESDGSWVVELSNAGYANGDSLSITAEARGLSGTVTLTVAEAAGTQKAPSIIWDLQPSLSVTQPPPGSTHAAETVEVRGTVEGAGPAPAVSVNGVAARVTAEGALVTFNATVVLSAGSNTLEAVAVDCLGATARRTVTVSRVSGGTPSPVGGGGFPAGSTPTAAPAAQAPTFSGLTLYPPAVAPGRTATASVVVRNPGAQAATLSVELRINGTLRETRTVALGPGESAPLAFLFTPDRVGDYSVEVGGLAATLRAVSAPDPFQPKVPSPSPSIPASPSPSPAGPSASSPSAAATPPPRRSPGFEVAFTLAALGLAGAWRWRRA